MSAASTARAEEGLPRIPGAGAEGVVKVYESLTRKLAVQSFVNLERQYRGRVFTTQVWDNIQYDVLRNYDVLRIDNQTELLPYTRDELKAIEKFVTNGGGLLLLTNAGGRGFRSYGPGARYAPRVASYSNTGWCASQIMELFGVGLLDIVSEGAPSLVKSHELNADVSPDAMDFKQRFGYLMVPRRGCEILAEANGTPTVVTLQSGKGRVLICASDQHLMYAPPHLVKANTEMLYTWTKWLGERSPNIRQPAAGLPRSIPGSYRVSSELCEVVTIPQLAEQARRTLAVWEQTWPILSEMTGVSRPLGMKAGPAGEGKMEVHIVAVKSGGLARGRGVWIPGLQFPDHEIAAMLGHEVGHKLVGGSASATSEGLANYLAIRVMQRLGFGEGDRREAEYSNRVKEAESRGVRIDVNDEVRMAQARELHTNKWTTMLFEFQEKYGDDFLCRYIACLRKDVNLVDSHHKSVNGKVVQIAFDDIRRALEAAAGEDLSEWLSGHGTSL